MSRLVIAFLPRSKRLLISWLQSPSAVILEPPKIKSLTVSTVSPSICHEVMGLDAMILVFWMLSFKLTFSLSSFTFIKKLFSFSLLSAIRASLVGQLVKNLPAMWKTWVQSLGWEDSPGEEKGCPRHSSGLEFAQIHVHWVHDTIWPSHPLPPPAPFAFNLSQHQDLF